MYNFTQKLVDLLTSNHASRIKAKSNAFLNCDAAFLSATYSQEPLPATGISYTPTVTFDGLQKITSSTTTVIEERFDRTQKGDAAWREQSDKVFKAFAETGKAKNNGKMIRPIAIEVTADHLDFTIQPCGYFDQAAAQLGLDKKEKPGDLSLRDMLNKDYPGLLPPLNDGRLSNSLGVGMVLFYTDKATGQFVPCIYQRNEQVAVFSGAPNCTASGAVDWPETDNIDVLTTVKNRIVTELTEETGLLHTDINNLQAIFIGREWVRGGKVQFFYAATTALSREEIAQRFMTNGRAARKAGVDEFASNLQVNGHKIDVLPSPATLENYLDTAGMAPEGAANLFYALPYLKSIKNG